MPQLSLARPQPFRNFAQRLSLSQLTEQHRYELAPTRESTRVPLGLMLPHRTLKLVARNQLENLTEDAAYSFHGEVSPGRRLCSWQNFHQPTRDFASLFQKLIWTRVSISETG